MPKHSKNFIDRKKAQTFRALHTCQQNATDELILSNNEQRWEEQKKYGIYFKDNYNYMQHLRDTKTTIEWIRVDSNVDIETTSCFNENEDEFYNKSKELHSLDNLKITQEDEVLDDDIMVTLEDSFDYDDPQNELEDNFMELANCTDASDNEEDISDTPPNTSVCENNVEKSVNSNLPKRNENLRFIDNVFEKMMENDFCDEDDDYEVGKITMDEFMEKYQKVVINNEEILNLDHDEQAIALTKKYSEQLDSLSEEEYDTIEIPMKRRNDECISFISTTSTQNLPKLIPTPKLYKNNFCTQINSKQNPKENTLSNSDMQSVTSKVSILSIRPKDETPEERKQRKSLLKEYRAERRQIKKENTLAYKKRNLINDGIQFGNLQATLGKHVV